MSGFFSHSSSRRRYPDPHRGGSHYKKKGLFGILSGFSGSGSGGYGGRRSRGYPGQDPYPQSGLSGGLYGGGQGGSGTGAAYMNCPKCGAAIPAGSKFCLECGEKVESAPGFCPNCGSPLQPGAKFCGECGSPVGGSGSGQSGSPVR